MVKLKDIQRVLAEIQFIRERSFPAGIDIENYIVITESLDKQIPKKHSVQTKTKVGLSADHAEVVCVAQVIT